MSDDLDALLANLTPKQRAALAARLAAPADAPAPVAQPTGTVTVSDDGRINGVAVGVNLGRIVYGRDPEEDERKRLVWYLARLAAKLSRLPLRGLDERLDQGEGVSLTQVYVMLATTERVEAARGPATDKTIRRYYEQDDTDRPLKTAYHPDYALPSAAIISAESIADPQPKRRAKSAPGRALYRAQLATDLVWQQRRLVLLGDPGGGKSTFLRHLAWALAQRGLDQPQTDAPLPGWEDARRRLPILVPLRTLAGALAGPGQADTIVFSALRGEIERYNVTHADDLLNGALHRGAALLLCDGLDEVPLLGVPGITADRRTTAQAVAAFVRLYPRNSAVITCRTRAFDDALRAELGWPAETLAPFTLGQIRHFVPAWYAELAQCGQLEAAQIARLHDQLLATIIASPKLRAMAETPLLLTMMALVLYNKGELPRDRPQLYERILELLLGQWDKLREGQSLAEAIGQPDWTSERIRPLLDRLSFQAHADATSADGRGRLARSAVHEALLSFFRAAQLGDAWAAAGRCLEYFNQRSGLLVPDDAQDSYTFAHLTLQEHCAGRHLLIQRDPIGAALAQRADDRWREPILLGLGVVQETNPFLVESLLRRLIAPDEQGAAKAVARRQRDLILAAEIGQDRDWARLGEQGIDTPTLQHDLRRGLAALLDDRDQPLPVVERVRAGFLLGELGDPRVPVTIAQWQDAIAQAQAGDASGYFCRVAAGAYTIGSADDLNARDAEKPQHRVTFAAPFLVARYPITTAQWQAWVQEGGEPAYYADDADLNRPNQPVVGVTWHACNAFCVWLSERLGLTVRLPSEQEWEAAARGGDARRYPWGDEWQADRAATKEDQATRGARYTVPVGCYPAGAAPGGARDMAGNVWEWTASVWQSYPEAEKPFTDDESRVLRGGGWSDSSTSVRCGARYGVRPAGRVNDLGFRVLAAPRLAR